jgi:hypothetical protein
MESPSGTEMRTAQHVVQNKAGTAESSLCIMQDLYHLAKRRTPPHSLATSFHAL